MDVLVVGGAGYIGSYMTKVLSKDYNVIVLDNLSTGFKESAMHGTFVQGDMNDPIILDYIFDKYNIDFVLHFCSNFWEP